MFNKYTYKQFLSKHSRVLIISMLAFIWVIGILTGFSVASRSSSHLLKLTLSLERVSFVGLVIAAILPLIISAIAVKLSAPLFILIVAFIKAFLFGFASFGLFSYYGDAIWLSKWLYMFSDSLMIVLLCWFWVRNIAGKTEHLNKDLATCLIAASLLICFDYFIVSPYSLMLFNYY